MLESLRYNATLVRRRNVTDRLAVFTVRPDRAIRGRHDAGFAAGQYTVVGLNAPAVGYKHLATVQRPMTIASAPEMAELELYIAAPENGASATPLIPALFELQAHDRLYVDPTARGHFTIEDTVGVDDPRTKIMVAAGIGIAPFVSSLRSRAFRGASLADTILVEGARTPRELAYRVQLDRLRTERGLRHVPTISRPLRARSPWTASTGRAESVFAPQRIEGTETQLRTTIRPEEACVFVCGLRGTIATMIEYLLPRGFVPDDRHLRQALSIDSSIPASLFYQNFDAMPLFDLKNPSVLAALQKRRADGLRPCRIVHREPVYARMQPEEVRV